MTTVPTNKSLDLPLPEEVASDVSQADFAGLALPTNVQQAQLDQALTRIENILCNVLSPDDLSTELANQFVDSEARLSHEPLKSRASLIVRIITEALSKVEPKRIGVEEKKLIREINEQISSFSDFTIRAEQGHVAGIDSQGASYYLLLAAVNSLSEHFTRHEENLAKLFYRESPKPKPIPQSSKQPETTNKEPVAPKKLELPKEEVIQPTLLPVQDAETEQPSNNEQPRSSGFLKRFLSGLWGLLSFGQSQSTKDVYHRLRHNDGTPKTFVDSRQSGSASGSTGGALGEKESSSSESLLQQAARVKHHFLANTPEDGVIGLNQAENPLPDESSPIGSGNGRISGSLLNAAGLSHLNSEMVKKGLDGNIVSEDPEFYKHVAINTPAVTIDASGKMLRLDKWLEAIRKANPDNPALPTYEECYQRKELLRLSALDERTPEETECSRSAFAGDVTLPLSPLYTITGVSFLDKSGNEIESKDKHRVDECIFGSARVQAPEGTMQVAYRVRPRTDLRIDPELVQKLQYALPQFSPFISPEDKGTFDRLKALESETKDKTQLWLESVRETPFPYHYTMSDPIMHLVNAAGPQAENFISAMKLNDCQGFSFHSSIRLRALGLGALVLGGPLPDQENKSFQVKIGHAQTGVVGKRGVTILDLTQHVPDSIEADALSIDWHRVIADLQGANAEKVHLIGVEVGKLVRQLAGAGNHQIDLNNHPYALKGWRKFRHSFGAFGRGRPLTEPPTHSRHVVDSFQKVKDTAFSKVIRVQEYLTDLEERIEYALQTGSLREVYRYIKKNPSPNFSLDYNERSHIGNEYTALVQSCRARAKGLVLEATKIAVNSTESSPHSCRECMAWVVEQSTPADFAAFEGGINEDISRVKKAGSRLTLHERSEFTRPELLKLLDDEQLQHFSVALLNDIRYVCRHSDSYNLMSEIDDLKKYATSFECCASELKDRENKPIFSNRHEVCLRSITFIAKNVIDSAANEDSEKPEELTKYRETRDSLLRSFDLMVQLGEKDRIKTSFDLIHSVKQSERGGVLKLLKALREYQGNQLFADTNTDVSFSAVAAQHLAQRLRNGGNDHYLISSLSGLGIVLDLSPHKDSLEEALVASTEQLTARWQDQAINYPDEQAPASLLTERLTNLEAARFFRYTESVVEHGGLEQERVKEAWPKTSEADVAHRVASKLTIREEILQYESSEYGYDRRTKIDPADIRCLVESGYRQGPLSQAFLAHYYNVNADFHELESLFEDFKHRFPEAWRELRQSLFQRHPSYESRIMGTLLARYGSGIDKIDFYRAALSLAAVRVRESSTGLKLKQHSLGEIEEAKEKSTRVAIKLLVSEMGKERAGKLLAVNKRDWESSNKQRQVDSQYNVLLKEYRSLLAAQADSKADKPLTELCASLPDSFTQTNTDDSFRQSLASVYSDSSNHYDCHKSPVTQQGKTLAFLAGAVAKEHSTLVISHMAKKLGLPAHYIQAVYQRLSQTEGSRVAQVWRHLRTDTGPVSPTGLLNLIMQRVEEQVGTATTQPYSMRPATFSNYLYQKIGRKTPLQHEGDFEEFRTYSPGMDWKRVDQKVLGRTDRAYVRYYRDKQKYKVVALVELEWLAEEASQWCQEQHQNEKAREKEKSSTERYSSGFGNFRRRRTRAVSTRYIDKDMITDLAEFPKLEELYTNLLLAERDGYKPKLMFTFRGHPVQLAPKGEEENMDLYTSDSFLNNLERASLGAKYVLDSEKEIYGSEEQYQGRAPICPEYIEPLLGTVVLGGIEPGNSKNAAWFFHAMKNRKGDVVPIEVRREPAL